MLTMISSQFILHVYQYPISQKVNSNLFFNMRIRAIGLGPIGAFCKGQAPLK